MEQAIKVINDLEKEGIIKGYALGGATALIFYAEPRTTYDVDIFIFLPESKKKSLIDLNPLYKHLKKRGYHPKNEHVIIEGIPIQFIPAPGALVEEGIKTAEIKDFNGVPIKVMRIEYLLAVMLQLNRPKDRERIGGLLDEKVKFDKKILPQILLKYNLKEKWEKLIAKTE